MLPIQLARPNATPSVVTATPGPLPRASRMPEICAALQSDPLCPEAVLRLIVAEMAALIEEMRSGGGPAEVAQRGKAALSQIRALCVLFRQVVQCHEHQRTGDTLDFDGPKFTHVFGVLVGWVREALCEVLGPEQGTTVNSALRHLRDLAAMGEKDLRREVAAMRRGQDAEPRNGPWWEEPPAPGPGADSSPMRSQMGGLCPKGVRGKSSEGGSLTQTGGKTSGG